GPEAPLATGIVDAFQDAGLACFGPRAAAAQLEASKAFSKDFLARHRIPTAEDAVFSDYDKATRYIREQDRPLVVKADGPAAGKGVVLAQTTEEALAAARNMLEGNLHGDAGARIIVEDFLVGEAASCLATGD